MKSHLFAAAFIATGLPAFSNADEWDWLRRAPLKKQESSVLTSNSPRLQKTVTISSAASRNQVLRVSNRPLAGPGHVRQKANPENVRSIQEMSRDELASCLAALEKQLAELKGDASNPVQSAAVFTEAFAVGDDGGDGKSNP